MKKIIILMSILFILILTIGCDKDEDSEYKETTLVVATTTEPTFNIFRLPWAYNPGLTKETKALTFGYSTVSFQKDKGRYEIDESVVKKFEVVVNVDGSKTYIITLHEDLLWSDGEKITAKDYVFSVLFEYNPVVKGAIGYSNLSNYLVGSIFYRDKDMNAEGIAEFEGVDLINEYQFSLTIGKENYPNYYDYTYYFVTPYPKHVIAPEAEVIQGTSGAKLVGLSKQDLIDKIEGDNENPGYNYTISVTSGPYVLSDRDRSNSFIKFTKNPLYKGNYEGKKPSIDHIIIKYVSLFNQLDMIKTGGIDLIPEINNAEQITNALAVVAYSNDALRVKYFSANSYRFIGFHCDEPSGPTASVKVRQAFAYICDRDSYANASNEGFYTIPDSQYGLSQWMVQSSMKDGKIQGRDQDGFLFNLNSYDYNKDKAINLLEEDGWVWADENAEISFDENNQSHTLRYKKMNDGSVVPLIIKFAQATSSVVSDYFNSIIVANASSIGMKVEVSSMDFNTMLYTHYYGMNGDGYLEPIQDENGIWLLPEYQKKDESGSIIEADLRSHHSFILSKGFSRGTFLPYQEISVEYWGWDGGMNTNYIYDQELIEAATKMNAAQNHEEYLYFWQQYQLRYNYLLPSIPLFSNTLHTVYNSKLTDFEVNAEWPWYEAVIYAKMEG